MLPCNCIAFFIMAIIYNNPAVILASGMVSVFSDSPSKMMEVKLYLSYIFLSSFLSFFAPKSQRLLQFAIVGCQKIITVCGPCDCKQTCTFHHDLLHRQTPGPESRSFQIMPLIWCSHHCLCIIRAGKPCNLLRVLCISDATANLEHLSVASATEHP